MLNPCRLIPRSDLRHELVQVGVNGGGVSFAKVFLEKDMGRGLIERVVADLPGSLLPEGVRP
jgi:hypothetical protein